MSRTWTSRTTTLPDWLIGVNRMPMESTTEAVARRSFVAGDIEGGECVIPSDISQPAAVHYAPAGDADTMVIPQNEAGGLDIGGHLGVAGMLEDPADHEQTRTEGSLRRRFTSSIEDVSITPPTSSGVQVCVVFVPTSYCVPFLIDCLMLTP